MTRKAESLKAKWRRFVKRRSPELRRDYPCAIPTRRRVCPKHRLPIPQTVQIPAGWIERPDGTWRYVEAQTARLSGICKQCRDGLYEQLAAEFIHAVDRAA